MDIEIDLSRNWFFISTILRKGTALSFDYTSKGHRVMKQVFRGWMSKPRGKPSGHWRALHVVDGEPERVIRYEWFDMGKRDVVNGEIWDTVWQLRLASSTSTKLFRLSRRVWLHQRNRRKLREVLAEIDAYVTRLARRYG